MQKKDTIKSLESAAQGPDDPFALFREWIAEAEKSEINDPNAMSLATIDPGGRPSLRIVLLKSVDERGFVFYTNRESRKGQALAAHPFAALCFHWKSLGRAVRIEGPVEKVGDDESDAYYSSRERGSRIGAWASQQSRPLDSRKTLVHAVEKMMLKYAIGTIPRPPYWGGYRLNPDYFEFWHDGSFRLHTRLVYKKEGEGWGRGMLYP